MNSSGGKSHYHDEVRGRNLRVLTKICILSVVVVYCLYVFVFVLEIGRVLESDLDNTIDVL